MNIETGKLGRERKTTFIGDFSNSSYLLSRKISGQSEWKNSIIGELRYILTVLELNLKSPILQGYEWKITPIS